MDSLANRMPCDGGRPFVLTMAVLVCILPKPQSGAEITSGGSVAPWPPTEWTVSTTAYVGHTGNGWIAVNNGDSLISGTSYLGYSPGTAGEVTLADNGTKWEVAGSLNVGYEGEGSVTITEAFLQSTDATLGHHPGSQGTVVVTGSGAKWDAGKLDVGYEGQGSVTITEAHLQSTAATLGYQQGSQGTVTVTGSKAKWDTGKLDVGYEGHGSVTITEAHLQSTDATLGYQLGAQGTAVVTGSGAKWDVGKLDVGYEGEGSVTITMGGEVNAGTLLANVKNIKGDGTLNATGIVLDGADLLLDGSAKQLNFGNGGKLNLTPTAIGTLGAGHQGEGSVTITVGIDSKEGLIGNLQGSHGSVTITKNGAWDIQDTLVVGNYGNGLLNIGGQVSADSAILGYRGGSSVTITVKPAATGNTAILAVDNDLTVGSAGSGVLRLQGPGAKATSGSLHLGEFAGSIGTVTVNEGGQLLVAGEAQIGSAGTGNVLLTNGGTFQAASVYLNNPESSLLVDAGNGSKLVAGNGAGTFQNEGTVTITLAPTAGEGTVYQPIQSAAWSGTGKVRALGGTWNQDTREFTASTIKQGTAGTLSMDLSQQQRATIHDPGNNWTIGLGFMGSVTPDTLVAQITPIGGTHLTALQALLPDGARVAGAWDFDFQSQTPGIAYLSFDIGSGNNPADLRLWHTDGSTWTPYNAWDLTYTGTFASFTVQGFSGYAVTIVPEPSLTLLLVAGVALIPRRRRRQG